ncbi:MAG TPA: hypothetical protein VJ463_06530 [Geothrix sp.]|nr:hypothetical protein [Geothrix sp.]
MTTPLPFALSLLLGTSGVQASSQPAAPTHEGEFALILRWAGEDAAARGFTRDQLLAFMEARSADIRAGRQAPWSDWLKGLGTARSANLRIWALARRVEAGDYSGYLDFRKAAIAHVRNMTRLGGGETEGDFTDPPRGFLYPMPGVLRLHPDSPFWLSLRKALAATPNRHVDEGMYVIWCHGTHPSQRDLILEVASRVMVSADVLHSTPDPWVDPRFWILTDWAVTWGMPEDFDAIRQALPEGPSRVAFDRIRRSLDEIPAFFSRRPEPPAPWKAPVQVPGPPPSSKADPVSFDFSQIRIQVQPAPPGYPWEAKNRKLMNLLVMDMVVDTEGRPLSCRPLPGPFLGFFAPTGAAFGLRWRFHPAQLNGVPVPARFRLTLPFRLRP